MEQKFKLTIPKPCNENWDEMIPQDNGRFCLNCSKTVIDFSSLLPEEIQHFFIQNQNKRICGRFKNSQLETITIQIPSRVLYAQTSYHKMFLLALFVAMGTTLFSCQNKDGNKHKIDKIEVIQDTGNRRDSTKLPAAKDSLLQKSQPSKITSTNFAAVSYVTKGEVIAVDHSSVSDPVDYDGIFNSASLDTSPVPEKGIENFYSFINDNYVNPNKTEKITGKIYITFIIEKDGSLSTFKIIKDAGSGTGEEAVRVLKIAPKWIPGQLDNHVVRTLYALPISLEQ
ncbi:energy transducer TonB [Flavobacterium bizetiae]|uniref:energy transducer TonB n=1 Tax=Flavobacterium bizetiae TaxID=2704140 RepID=UPI0021E75657|nr:energy transducer TonB [Flavobacterium bizetiae]UTN05829.1 energy transducer TonB [Flavobacterium bizetiae]